ncbi:MAG: hypothetical protein FWF87_07300 [Synergistaceae bacterium]|nr:hypothetical protein [Synergistaceae bacterium]
MKIIAFHAGIGGHLGNSYSVEYIGENRLLYKVYGKDSKSSEQTIEFTDKQEQAFIEVLASVGVNNWERRYNDPFVLDGTSWSFGIISGEVIYDGRGSNAYPPRFEEFITSVRTLLGVCHLNRQYKSTRSYYKLMTHQSFSLQNLRAL